MTHQIKGQSVKMNAFDAKCKAIDANGIIEIKTFLAIEKALNIKFKAAKLWFLTKAVSIKYKAINKLFTKGRK